MANVHGFGDINQQNRGGARQPMLGGVGGVGDDPRLQEHLAQNKIPFMNTLSSDRSPLDETIPYTLIIVWCPTIRIFSITVALLIIIWGYYIFCCTQGINPQSGVLQVSTSVLQDYGGLTRNLVKQSYEIWRLITAAFMHVDLLHITMNSLSILFLLTRLEAIYQPLLILILLLVSAISGSILSLLLMSQNVISVGSSTMIFGILGCLVGYMTMNWNYLGAIRSQLCCIIGLILFFSILFSFSSGVDAAGHFGGLIGGYFITLGVFPAMGEKNKIFIGVGIGCLIVYFLTTFLVFFLT